MRVVSWDCIGRHDGGRHGAGVGAGSLPPFLSEAKRNVVDCAGGGLLVRLVALGPKGRWGLAVLVTGTAITPVVTAIT